MNNIYNIISVGIGGFIGSIIRYLVYLYFNKGLSKNVNTKIESSSFYLSLYYNFPIATFLVNIIGCFLIGFLMAYIEKSNSIPEHIRLFVITGILGSLTTFSTFSFESFDLFKNNHTNIAIIYLFLSVILGLIFCIKGYSISSVLFSK